MIFRIFALAAATAAIAIKAHFRKKQIGPAAYGNMKAEIFI